MNLSPSSSQTSVGQHYTSSVTFSPAPLSTSAKSPSGASSAPPSRSENQNSSIFGAASSPAEIADSPSIFYRQPSFPTQEGHTLPSLGPTSHRLYPGPHAMPSLSPMSPLRPNAQQIATLHLGLFIGIAVGLGSAFIICAACCLWWRKRKDTNNSRT